MDAVFIQKRVNIERVKHVSVSIIRWLYSIPQYNSIINI